MFSIKKCVIFDNKKTTIFGRSSLFQFEAETQHNKFSIQSSLILHWFSTKKNQCKFRMICMKTVEPKSDPYSKSKIVSFTQVWKEYLFFQFLNDQGQTVGRNGNTQLL